MRNILITGGTGFLGSQLITEILSSSDDVIHAVVRGKTKAEAAGRLMSILEKISKSDRLNKEYKERIHVYAGDVTRKNLGLTKEEINYLVDNIDIIYHSAATTELNLPLEEARNINVGGTENILDFALMCKERGRLKKINNVSTAYVVGTKKCLFKENDLDVGQGFNNTYEQSKYESEKTVYRFREKGLDIDIFRPGIILGRHSDGMTMNFKMFYQPLHFFSLELFDRIPAMENSRANIINVDIAARAAFLISGASRDKNMNYHIVSPDTPCLDRVLNIASDFFGFKKPDFVSENEIDVSQEYSFVKRKIIEPYLPYFNYVSEFDMRNTLGKLKKGKFSFPEFDEENFIRLYSYCDAAGFIKRKRKSVTVK